MARTVAEGVSAGEVAGGVTEVVIKRAAVVLGVGVSVGGGCVVVVEVVVVAVVVAGWTVGGKRSE